MADNCTHENLVLTHDARVIVCLFYCYDCRAEFRISKWIRCSIVTLLPYVEEFDISKKKKKLKEATEEGE